MRPKVELKGFKLSDDHGKHWRTVVLCPDCRGSIEPPTLLRPLGDTAVMACEWCGALNGSQPVGSAFDDEVEQWKIDGFNYGIGKTIFGVGLRHVEPTVDEDLPTDCVMLDIAYSPVIPISGGTLDDAVEVEKINNFTYRFEYNFQQHTVSDEKLKEMRARYIVTHNLTAARYMRDHNPKGNIWRTLADNTLENVSLSKKTTTSTGGAEHNTTRRN